MLFLFNPKKEPSIFGDHGYEDGQMAPGLLGNRWSVRHNTVLAHIKAYQRYEKYRPTQKGQVGITLHSIWVEPFSETAEDLEAAEVAMGMVLTEVKNTLTRKKYFNKAIF